MLALSSQEGNLCNVGLHRKGAAEGSSCCFFNSTSQGKPFCLNWTLMLDMSLSLRAHVDVLCHASSLQLKYRAWLAERLRWDSCCPDTIRLSILLLMQGGKASAAAVPQAPVYNVAEFKHDLMAPVQQILRDAMDNIAASVQSEEQNVASCLRQQLLQKQESVQMQATPQAAVQETWDVFVVLRSESQLGLCKSPSKSKGRNIANQ